MDSDALGSTTSPKSQYSRGTPRSQKKSDRARERERVVLTLYMLKTSKSESDLCGPSTHKQKRGTVEEGDAPFMFSEHFFMPGVKEEDQSSRLDLGKAFSKITSLPTLPLSFSRVAPRTPATSSTAQPSSQHTAVQQPQRHQFDNRKKVHRSRSSGGNLGSCQTRRYCSNQDWSAILKAETEFQQKKEDSDDTAEEKMLSGLYKVFCSISGADNKVEIDTFVKIAYEGDIFQKLGPRSDIALRSIATSTRVDWATLAWYLVSPATVGDCYFPTRQKGQCLYEFFTSCFPTLRDTFNFARARDLIRRYQGLRGLRQWLVRKNYLDGDLLDIRETAPFNFFALAGGGKLVQTNMEQENECLGEYKEQFVVVRNLPHHDRHWNDPEYAGNSSMARRHRFIALKNLRYEWFNALAFGLQPDRLEEALKLIHDLKEAAKKYSENMGWSSVGLFCHIFGHNSVPSFHLHMVDLLTLGPSYFAMQHKNCRLDVVEQVLQDELKNRLPITDRRVPDFLAPGRASGLTSFRPSRGEKTRQRGDDEVLVAHSPQATTGSPQTMTGSPQTMTMTGRTGGSSVRGRFTEDGSPLDVTIFSKLSEETLSATEEMINILDDEESFRYSGNARHSSLDIGSTPQSFKIQDICVGVDMSSPAVGKHHAKSSSPPLLGGIVVRAGGGGSVGSRFAAGAPEVPSIDIKRLNTNESIKSLGTILSRPHPTIVDFLLRLRMDEPFRAFPPQPNAQALQQLLQGRRRQEQEVEEKGGDRSDKKTCSPSGLTKPFSNNDNNDDDGDDDNEVGVPHTKCESIHESKGEGGEGVDGGDGDGDEGVRGEHASASSSKSPLPGSRLTSSDLIVRDESKDEEVLSPHEAAGEGSGRKNDKKGVSDSPGNELEEHGSEDTQTRRHVAVGGLKKRKKEGKNKNKK